jgi:hypothetical protein
MRVVVVALFLALAACSSQEMACRNQAGLPPYAWAGVFGFVGASIAASTPEYKAWQQGIDDCVAREEAAR